MLAKKKRLTTRDFALVMEKGREAISGFFVVKHLPGPDLKVSPAVSKKVWKTAPARNRARRRIYGALRAILSGDRVRPGLVVVIARRPFDRLSPAELEQALREPFVKAGIIA